MGKLTHISKSHENRGGAGVNANFDFSRMGPVNGLVPVLLFLMIGWAGPLSAQPFPGPKPAPKPAAPAAPTIPTKPSRYQGDKVEEFVQEMSGILAIRSRTTGPFGEPQDPDAAPKVDPGNPMTLKRAPEPVVSLAEIIQMIEINTIMPREKRFLIGGRSISQGQTFPVTYKGKLQKIQVVQVTSEQIIFRNAATGETAARPLSKLPAGMTPGSSNTGVPGMQSASEEAPIELDATPSP